jgi:RNA polymerase sigma factor (sigma-70 family)
LHQPLIEACKKGNQKAQFELYRLYYRSMYNSALRIVGDPDDAEDVMQEAFLKAFVKIRSYRGEVSFGAWLKKIVVNKSLDFLRTRKEVFSLDEAGEPEEIREEEPVRIDKGITSERIRDAIYSLPEGYRVVLSLILLEGYDHQEVSEILNISNATSRTQYHRARKKLAALLKEKE